MKKTFLLTWLILSTVLTGCGPETHEVIQYMNYHNSHISDNCMSSLNIPKRSERNKDYKFSEELSKEYEKCMAEHPPMNFDQTKKFMLEHPGP